MLWRWVPYWVATIAVCATRAKADPDPYAVGTPDLAPATQVAPAPPSTQREAGYRDHPVHLELILGADTRVGELGMSLEYALGDALSLGAGVGTNGFGAEWALNARVRPLWWRVPNGSVFYALTLEGSLSRATEGSVDLVPCIDGCEDTSVVPQTVYFAQGELGWEAMTRKGFTFRVSSGFANAIGSRLWRCSEHAAYCKPPAQQFFVQTFALGLAF
jgi:hypothetical protein